ncbi:outer membrane protein assembly factor BamD [Thiohalomonas denitrificans]|uniref:Outer membrane protein assembly factor BamD n=1 Tax=Thiohalomonas denitrificans TaxID=415747 RepID=A0A1G5PLJ6_9GAMM|nr:outer membrane protein assembly factor BamD [Thiohalomonas denitrificans]SCZ50313.1 Beta-barrel assembly machine subunit BamD [Thiohalomonas denitrificans]
MRIFTLLPLLVLLLTAGCAGLPEADETADWSASEIYEKAKAALDNGNYEQALGLYSKLEARYPYGRFAQQAQLETIYAHYEADEPEAAIAAADRFIKLHPRHPNVDYAYYMRGLASFDIGGGFLERFFPSDPAERDPARAREAFRHFRELTTKFPESRYAEDAIKRMAYLRNNLARHEIQVAQYYMRRDAYLAAVERARYVLESYESTPAVPDALGIMVTAYRAMDMPKLADDALRVLRQNYPEHRVTTQLEKDN